MSENKTMKPEINVPWYVKAAVPVAGAGVGFAIGKDWLSALIGAIAAPIVGMSAKKAAEAYYANQEEPVQDGPVPIGRCIDEDPAITDHLATEAAKVVLNDPVLMEKIREMGNLQPIPSPVEDLPPERCKPMMACARLYDIICSNPQYQDTLYEILDDLEETVASRIPEVTPSPVECISDGQTDDRK